VRAGNEAAILLYKEEGFVLEGRERNQVRTREGYEDNLIMAKFLVD
jgi:ribosomal protein S18 acetylase RimI-like enzyme